MAKYTFKMNNRMKFVLMKNGTNSFSFIVSGKSDTDFRMSKKRAEKLISQIRSCTVYGVPCEFEFNKTTLSNAGKLSVEQKDLYTDTYTIKVVLTKANGKSSVVFEQEDVPKKTVRKLYRTMQEVYEVE